MVAATLILIGLTSIGMGTAVHGQDVERSAPVRSYTVAARYPHDPTAYTQGLQWSDGRLYEGTGFWEASDLRLVDLETGSVLMRRVLNEPNATDPMFGEGITLLDGRIYQLTWKSQVAFVYDAETFEPIEQFSYETEGWGLTTDGAVLYMSDGSSRIAVRDPASFEVVRTIDVEDGGAPVALLNELEYIDGSIWANVYQTNRIARIDPATGAVQEWLDLSALATEVAQQGQSIDVLNGIAWKADTETLLVTGKWWPTLFELKLEPVS